MGRENAMSGLALIQSKVQVNDTWLDYFIIGVYFVFVLGIGAVLRSRMQTSEDYFFAPTQPVQGSLGFNVNLWWGLVMVVSGCMILGLSLASPRRAAREAANRG
jgi:hypothetical protein